jgi:hypothetical protein
MITWLPAIAIARKNDATADLDSVHYSLYQKESLSHMGGTLTFTGVPFSSGLGKENKLETLCNDTSQLDRESDGLLTTGIA